MTDALPDNVIDMEINYLKCCEGDHDMRLFLPVLRAYAAGCESIAEFGVRKGMSSIAFASARPANLYSFDHDPCVNGDALWEMCRDAQVDWIFQLCDIYDLAPWPLSPDLLFLDADHTYSGVTRQLEMFAASVKQWIIIHDSVSFPEVLTAAMEYIESRPEWILEREYTEWPGLLVLRRVLPIS